MINTLAQEGAKYNIHANAVAPIAATRMTEDILPKEVLEKLTPEYVAPVVAYLCTEENPNTASVFVVGGGKVQRVALFQNEGANFDTPPSVQDVASHWSEIDRPLRGQTSQLQVVAVRATPRGLRQASNAWRSRSTSASVIPASLR